MMKYPGFTHVKGLQPTYSKREHFVGVQAAFHIGQAFRFQQNCSSAAQEGH
jgi:hypothetical protein